MFGLSWAQIAIIVLVGVFVLGPERIPTAVTWVMSTLRKARTMAAGAQAELRREIGPELDELRRQVADLQSLKDVQELRDLRDLHPKRLIGKSILGEEFSGGITGFLGLNEPLGAAKGTGAANATGNNGSAMDTTAIDAGAAQSSPGNPPTMNGAVVKPAQSTGRPGNPGITAGAGRPMNGTNGPAQASPSMTKLAAPKLVGGAAARPQAPVLPPGERPPFDPDGT